MSKFKPGDRVWYMRDHSDAATVLAVHEDLYWLKYDDEEWPATIAVADLDRSYGLISESFPESFLPDGQDRYCNVFTDGSVGATHSTLAEAENVNSNKRGIIRINGQTGELSWAKGGPKEGLS